MSEGTVECCLTEECCKPSGRQEQNKKTSSEPSIIIDFLYLDLDVCSRCQGTEQVLLEAIAEIRPILESLGKDICVNKVNVNTEDLAQTHQLVSSPTIRINGRDMASHLVENECESCGDLCGDTVDCRVWVWRGDTYGEPPKAMIIEAILHALYAPSHEKPHVQENQTYVMPDNLKRFFQAMSNRDSTA